MVFAVIFVIILFLQVGLEEPKLMLRCDLTIAKQSETVIIQHQW